MSPARERTLIVISLAFLVYPLYFPLSHYGADRASAPAIFLDHQTPLIADWMWAYFMVYLTAVIPIAVVRQRALLRRVALSYLAIMIVSFNIFWIFPVRMTLRPENPAVDSFVTWGLRLCYYLDQPLNCFPSLHVALTVLAAMICWKVDRFWGALAWVGSVAVSASTMLVKQHFFADVVAGIALALLSYRFLVHPADVSRIPRTELCFPRWVGGMVVLGYAGIVGVLYLLYRAGWQPW